MAVVPGERTILASASASSGSFTAIAQVLMIKPPGVEAVAIPITDLSSTTKAYRKARIPNNTPISMRIQYDPSLSAHRTLVTDALTSSGDGSKWYRISYADGLTSAATDLMQGFVSNFEPSELEDETNVEADLEITPVGGVTRTAGS